MDERARMMALLGPIAEEMRVEYVTPVCTDEMLGRVELPGYGLITIGSQEIDIVPTEGIWEVYNVRHLTTRARVPDDELQATVFSLITDALWRMQYIHEPPGVQVEEPYHGDPEFPQKLMDALGGLVGFVPVFVPGDRSFGVAWTDGAEVIIQYDAHEGEGWLVGVDGSPEAEDYIRVSEHDYAGFRSAFIRLAIRSLHGRTLIHEPERMPTV